MIARTSTCPKTPTLATEAEILAGCEETFYGVPLAQIGEEGLNFIAIGHPEPRHFIAALLAYGRAHRWDPYELGLRNVTFDAVEKAKGYHHIYRHADGIVADEPDLHLPDWCVCDDCQWWAVPASGGDDATPTTWWVV